ncbi:MAG: FtsX-like permease family protein [Mucilaginibacter sp.]|nr:FtsX-like permease family protein [Mucilaginibacter sp.]
MIKNYFKIAIRNLQRNKAYSLINIIGLTIGLTACLLVSTVVLDDLSYDHQWKNAENIYRIISIDNSNKNAVEVFPQSFTGLGPTLKKTFPEVSQYCRMSVRKRRLKMGANKDGVEIKSLSAEPSIWKVLDFSVIQGNPQYFVKGYKNLVITEKIKAEYFANTNPIGKTITDLPEFGKPGNYMITGVIKNIPANSHLKADVLEISEMRPGDDILEKQGFGTFAQQYLMLKPGASVSAFVAKANKWYKNYFTSKQFPYTFYLQPIKDVYLRSSNFSSSGDTQGDIRNVYIFSGVAVLLLLIACINFINLTTARALKRIREAGIRKVLGAGRGELVAQFLFESLLFFIISFVLAMILYSIFLKSVETYAGHQLTLTFQSNIVLFLSTCSIVLLVSILTGIYPALIISAQNPVSTIKGQANVNVSSNFLRKGLVVTQFTISVAILIVTIIVQDQLHFMDNKDLGFDKNNLLHINWMSWEGKGQVFKQEALMLSGVKNATLTTWYPSSGSGGYMSSSVNDPNQKNNKLKVWYINADFDFVSTLKLHLKKGRLLDSKLSTDAINTDSLMEKSMDKLEAAQKAQPVLITDFTTRILGVKDLNKSLHVAEGVPVGIINDFNNESLKTDMKPLFIRASKNIMYGDMLLRIQPGTEKQVLAGMYKIWQQFFPDKVFQYDWIDDQLRDQYKAEHKLQQLFTLFSFLILFLAALGLLGLTIFTTELKIKEIGIRKVLGASVPGITALLSKDFIKPVLLAIIIASPVAWYAMNKWLQNYAYHIAIPWWIFVFSGLIAVFIAFVTISYQTIKAALANPVKSLRSE